MLAIRSALVLAIESVKWAERRTFASRVGQPVTDRVPRLGRACRPLGHRLVALIIFGLIAWIDFATH
jgi:hypothetical protein